MYEVKIIKLNHQGVGIGKIEEKIVFIPNTLPNDIVKVELVKDCKKYYEGKVIKYIHLSEERTKFKCPYYEKCGGCQLGCLKYDSQLEYKVSKVQEILTKYADINLKLNIISSNKINGYRNKITLHVKNNKLGYYFNKTNELVEIDNCLLASKRMNQIISLLKGITLSGIKEIIIRENNKELMVIMKGKISRKQIINILGDYVKSIYINDECIYGKKYLVGSIKNYDFKISSDAFFQVNNSVATKLYDLIKSNLNDCKDKTIMDLFCGTGTIGIYVSNCCKSVLGLEINKNSILDALDNGRINDIKNIKFRQQDVSKITRIDKDIIIVDPPRMGLTNNITDLLINSKPEKIIYVSCNPLTLVRDLKKLKEAYNITDITLLDMFPNTYHVECVCVLNRH